MNRDDSQYRRKTKLEMVENEITWLAYGRLISFVSTECSEAECVMLNPPSYAVSVCCYFRHQR